MSKVDRNKPARSSASESRYTIFEFEAEFPDDAACLAYLVEKLYPEGIYCPKCERVTKHHRVKARPAYSCQFCGHYEYPMKGTIFEGSATSLRLWFYAIHLMASTRGGISAKQLERELGVTYKCAWRMFNKIRSLLGQEPSTFRMARWRRDRPSGETQRLARFTGRASDLVGNRLGGYHHYRHTMRQTQVLLAPVLCVRGSDQG